MLSETKSTRILKIGGMSCENCVGHVTKALTSLSGVETAQVDLDTGRAIVIYDPKRVDTQKMIRAVEEEGYEAALG